MKVHREGLNRTTQFTVNLPCPETICPHAIDFTKHNHSSLHCYCGTTTYNVTMQHGIQKQKLTFCNACFGSQVHVGSWNCLSWVLLETINNGHFATELDAAVKDLGLGMVVLILHMVNLCCGAIHALLPFLRRTEHILESEGGEVRGGRSGGGGVVEGKQGLSLLMKLLLDLILQICFSTIVLWHSPTPIFCIRYTLLRCKLHMLKLFYAMLPSICCLQYHASYLSLHRIQQTLLCDMV